MSTPAKSTPQKPASRIRSNSGLETHSAMFEIIPKEIIKHLPYKKFKTPSYIKQPCVIVSCGSFSPPTYLHLRIMEEAKYRLEQEFEVIGGILSPVNDEYGVLHKKSLQAANGTHRVKMATLATECSSWIGVSDFEVSLDKWSRVAMILNAYGKAINYYFEQQQQNENENENDKKSNKDDDDDKKKPVLIKFLGGSDLLSTMKIPNLWSKKDQETILSGGMAVIERHSHAMDDDFFESYDLFKKHRKNIHIIKSAVENTISSTKVRELIQQKHSLKYLTPDSVIDYIRKEKLYGMM